MPMMLVTPFTGTTPANHGALLGLANDDHAQYARLGGRIGGQTLIAGTAASDSLILRATANVTDGEIVFQTDGTPTEVARMTTSGFSVSQQVQVAGSPTALLVTGAAHTTLATGVEASDVNLNLNRIVQFATGAIATQRAVRVQAPTYAFVGASVVTDAATVAVSGAPIAGANATLTNSYALWIQSGTTRVQGRVYLPDMAGGNPTIAIFSDPTTGVGAVAGQVSIVAAANVTAAVYDDHMDIATAATVTPADEAMTFTVGARTLMTATVELNDILINLSGAGAHQWSTGAIAVQRAILISAPTYSFVGASTITDAATLSISGAPGVGANATLTNAYALWVESGNARFGAQILAPNGAAGTPSYAFFTNQTTGMTLGGGVNEVNVISASNVILAVFEDHVDITTAAFVTSVAPALTINPGAKTLLTTTVELQDILIDLSGAGDHQWATGAIATQRAILINAPTYSFVGASTITNAATLAISGAPAAGANATLTNSYALWIQGGDIRLDITNPALGGGIAPTLGTIGGTGPAAAAQNSWLQVNIGGAVRFIPLWA